MKKLALLLIVCCLFACRTEEKELTANEIIERAIEEAGGERYTKADIEFIFRKNTYTSSRDGGLFEYTRTLRDSIGEIKDVLNNAGMKRYRAEQEVRLTDSLAAVYAESVNSVHYFMQLPYGLNDSAVQKELVGKDSIAGKPYYEIKVTFKQEGGGADHEDIYMYWVNRESFTVDYLAYRFYVNDGGIRFRVAVNPREKKGIRFVDYENFKIEDLSTPLQELDELYENGSLKKVSEIRNKIVEVKVN